MRTAAYASSSIIVLTEPPLRKDYKPVAIKDVPSLRRHLQWAIELEHSTIPPYMTALYSLHEGKNDEARRVLLSVVIEEMLHMTLAANVLNAIGGAPKLDHPGFMPVYPSYLPHSDRAFQVPLQKFSQETLEVFLRIEKPEAHEGLPEDDNYETIGQFYEAIEEALVRLCQVHGEAHVFTGDPARQIHPEAFHYDGGGEMIVVTDLATAKKALDEVVEQGEGMDHQSIWDGDHSMFHHERPEVSHYFRLRELLDGRYYKHGDTPQSGPTGRPCLVDWQAVYNLRPNPRSSDYPQGSAIHAKMDEFNRAYCDLLGLMHLAFNGEPARMSVAVGAMYQIKALAGELVRMPSGDGGTTVGMSYEYVAQAAASEEKSVHCQDEPAAIGSIRILPHGPIIVDGPVPLRVKTRVMSDLKEALTWKTGATLRETGPYALCRCGRSDSKPFCDGSHARGHKFVGTETADAGLREAREKDYPGPKLSVHHDRTICAFSTFCENKVTDVWAMAEKTDDVAVRTQIIGMIEKCPSGALTYKLHPEEEMLEPDLPRQISVTDNGPLWVSGGIPIERADAKPVETRNRVTLCRCGHSKNKPFCDGQHIDVGFKG
jgi:CDGSH-type Zn-finger protein/rubrerythrin